MGRIRTMRQEDIDWMLANYENKSIEECATELNISIRTVSRWADALGLVKKKPGPKKTPDHQLKRMDCSVKKCCFICTHLKDCTKALGINETSACKLVCWKFELNPELAIDHD